jgi:hypothetical protein
MIQATEDFVAHFNKPLKGTAVYEGTTYYHLLISNSNSNEFVQLAQAYNKDFNVGWAFSQKGQIILENNFETTKFSNIILQTFCQKLIELDVLKFRKVAEFDRTPNAKVIKVVDGNPKPQEIWILQKQLRDAVTTKADTTGKISLKDFIKTVNEFIAKLRAKLEQSLPKLDAAISALEQELVVNTPNGRQHHDTKLIDLKPGEVALVFGDQHQHMENAGRVQLAVKNIASQKGIDDVRAIHLGDLIHEGHGTLTELYTATESFDVIEQFLDWDGKLDSLTGNHDVFEKFGIFQYRKVNIANCFLKADRNRTTEVFQGVIFANLIKYLNAKYGEKLQRLFDLQPNGIVLQIEEEDQKKKKKRKRIWLSHSFTDTPDDADIDNFIDAVNDTHQSSNGLGNMPFELSDPVPFSGKSNSWGRDWMIKGTKQNSLFEKFLDGVEDLFLCIFGHTARGPTGEINRPHEKAFLLQNCIDDLCAVIEIHGTGEIYIVYLDEDGKPKRKVELKDWPVT